MYKYSRYRRSVRKFINLEKHAQGNIGTANKPRIARKTRSELH